MNAKGKIARLPREIRDLNRRLDERESEAFWRFGERCRSSAFGQGAGFPPPTSDFRPPTSDFRPPYPDLTAYNSISFWSCYCRKSLAEQKIVRGMFVKGIGTNPLANKKERGPPSPPVPHSPDNHSPDDRICVNQRSSAVKNPRLDFEFRISFGFRNSAYGFHPSSVFTCPSVVKNSC